MDNGEKKSGLRFDIAESGGLVFDGADENADTNEKSSNTAREEFALPESYSVNEKYNTPIKEEAPAIPVKRTYVPRFTSASENYRMLGLERTAYKNERIKTPVSDEPEIDPTAEIEEKASIEPVVVVSNPDKSDNFADESIKIYKFQTENSFAVSSDADEVFKRAEQESAKEEPDVVEEPIEEPEVSASSEAKESVEKEPDYSVKKKPGVDFYEDAGPLAQSTEKSSSSEFNVRSERDTVKDGFLDAIMSVKVRLIAALILSLGMLLISALSYFGNFSFEYIGSLHNGEAVIDLFFATSVLALALPELVRTLRYLAKRVVCPELFLPVSYILLVGYTLTVTLDNSVGAEYMSFAILFASQVIVAILASYFRLTAEFKSFRLISHNSVKYAVDERYTRTLERENMALDGAIDEYSSRIARVYRTGFVSDFRRRLAMVEENSQNVLIMLGASFGLALTAGIVALFVTFSPNPRFLVGAEAMLTVFMLAVPTFSILLHKLPLKHTVDYAAKEGGTFVGEGAVYDGARVDVIAYKDTEIFTSEDVSVRKVHLYGKVYNTAKAMRQMYSIFSAVGGPLEEVFASSLDRKCKEATDIIIEDDGIMGVFEGHRVMAGTEEYMRRHNVTIPEDDYKTKTLATDSTKVMYGAEDGEVYVKFFIRYSFSEEFTMLLPEFKARKIVPLVYSSDPNITCELLRVLTLGEDNIRVMRLYTTAAPDKVYRRASSGIVTLSGKADAVNLLLMSHNYVAFQSGFAVSELISMIVGASLAVVLSFAFIGNIAIIPGFALVVWPLGWCGVLYVRSRLTFRKKKG